MSNPSKLTSYQNDPGVRESLERMVRPGEYVTTMIRAGSGETDYVRCFVATTDGRVAEITGSVARFIGRKIGKRGGIIVRGGGFDKGYEIVDHLARELYADRYMAEQAKPHTARDYVLFHDRLPGC